MPTAVTETPLRPVAQDPPRKRWTRSECTMLEAAGVFEQERLELIEGELINKMGKRRPHVGVVSFLTGWLIRVFGDSAVNAEAPIDVAPEDNPTNEPVPDLVVVKHGYAGYWSSPPQPQDLELVIGVADTTLVFDLTIKAALYGRAGIREYWVLDIPGRRLIVHRDPLQGRYKSIVAYSERESVAPLAAPDSHLRIADLLPGLT